MTEYHPRDHLDGIEEFAKVSSLQWKNGAVRRASGHPAVLDKLFQEWATAYRGGLPLPSFPQFSAMLTEVLQEAANDQEEDVQEIPDVEDWIREQIQDLTSDQASENGPLLQYDDGSGTWLDGVGFPATNGFVEALVLERFYLLRDTTPAIRTLWPKDRVQIVLVRVLASYAMKAICLLRETIRHEKASENGGVACLKWVLEDVLKIQDPGVSVEVMRHWLWQVKRFTYGLHVPSPLMINILRPQGCGKTQFISMLAGVPGLFGSFMETASLSTMGDSRDMDLWSSKLIVHFDELAFSSEYGNEARNIEAMKKILTSTYNSRRDLGKNTRSKMKRIFSAVACSNASIVQRIYDPTGMRRYFEMVSQRTDRMTSDEHAQVFGEPTQALGSQPDGAMNPLMIWRSIDETRETGYIVGDLQKVVEAIQLSYKRADLIEYIWREDEGDVPHPYDGEDLQSLVEKLS